MDDSISSLNTKLSASIAFSSAMLKVFLDLPGIYWSRNLNLCISTHQLCYSCQIFKLLGILLLGSSLLVSFSGVFSGQRNSEIIIPEDLLNNSVLELKPDDFMRELILLRSKNIESENQYASLKGRRLNTALQILLLAIMFAFLDVLLTEGLEFGYSSFLNV